MIQYLVVPRQPYASSAWEWWWTIYARYCAAADPHAAPGPPRRASGVASPHFQRAAAGARSACVCSCSASSRLEAPSECLLPRYGARLLLTGRAPSFGRWPAGAAASSPPDPSFAPAGCECERRGHAFCPSLSARSTNLIGAATAGDHVARLLLHRARRCTLPLARLPAASGLSHIHARSHPHPRPPARPLSLFPTSAPIWPSRQSILERPDGPQRTASSTFLASLASAASERAPAAGHLAAEHSERFTVIPSAPLHALPAPSRPAQTIVVGRRRRRRRRQQLASAQATLLRLHPSN